MKLETFFAKFDQFAAAPDAVEKMRELVLDLQCGVSSSPRIRRTNRRLKR